MINVRLLPGYNNMRDESKIEIYLIKFFCLSHHFLQKKNCENSYENIMKKKNILPF